MKSPAISIIVPVYMAETYLKRCVDSIVSQFFTDWELLLIDDGSPDNSGYICDSYANKDSRIKVIHKRNGGVSSARETGISVATGDFSIHVDPDDWIEPNMLAALYKRAEDTEADIVVCDLILDYGKHSTILKQSVISDNEFFKQLLCQEKHGSLCNKLIRTELYRRYDLHFPEKLICWEDLYICCNILLHPCHIEYIPEAFYHYDFHSNPSSMVRKATMKTIEGMKFFCKYFDNILPEEHRVWLNETKGIVLATAYRCNLMPAEEIRTLFPEINNWYVDKYRHAYDMPVYYGVAQVLNGKSIQLSRLFQILCTYYLRIKNKFTRIF